MTWDPYAALGVSVEASATEIKRAYRLLVRKYHPDVRPDDAKAAREFARARAAFDIIGDAGSRARYDRGEIDVEGQPRRYSYRDVGGSRSGSGQAHGFESIFDNPFGRSAQPGASGADWRHRIDLDFLQAIKGCSRRLKLRGGVPFDVRIPAGVGDGQVLRLKGKGHVALGAGRPGDALITVRVSGHSSFSRSGKDVRMDARISLTEAVEGGRITITGPTGPLSVTVPSGAGSGDVLRLKGKGVQSKSAGDLLVRLMVVVPEEGRDELRSFLKGWSGRSETPDR